MDYPETSLFLKNKELIDNIDSSSNQCSIPINCVESQHENSEGLDYRTTPSETQQQNHSKLNLKSFNPTLLFSKFHRKKSLENQVSSSDKQADTGRTQVSKSVDVSKLCSDEDSRSNNNKSLINDSENGNISKFVGLDNSFKSNNLEDKDFEAFKDNLNYAPDYRLIVDNWFSTWPVREKKSKKKFDYQAENTIPNKLNENHCYESRKVRKNDKRSSWLSSSFEDTLGENGNLVFKNDLKINESFSNSIFVCDSFRRMNPNSKESKTPNNLTLDNVLESLPLVYDPSTKQLCLGVDKKSINSKKESHNLLDRVLNRPIKNNLELESYDETDFKKNIGSSHEKTNLHFGQSSSCDGEDEEVKESLLSSNSICHDNIKDSVDIACEEMEEKVDDIKYKKNNNQHKRDFELSFQSKNKVTTDQTSESDSLKGNSLPRTTTSASLSFTDASSVSSISSSNTEVSLASASDSAVCLASDTVSLKDLHLDIDCKGKKKAFTDFFPRLEIYFDNTYFVNSFMFISLICLTSLN